MMNEYQLDNRHQSSGFGQYLLSKSKRMAKRWAWGLLAPILIPAAIITLGALLVALMLSTITNAGVAPELREGSDYYEAIAASVNPPEVDSEQELTWGVLKAAEFILGSGKSVEELAERLAPEVVYSDFETTVVRTGPDGKPVIETLTFNLVSEIRTYNTIYRYDYDFTDWGDEVTWERQEVERIEDRAKLNNALAWYAGVDELDEMTVYLIEQTAYSIDTGEMRWSFGAPASAYEGQMATWPVVGPITSAFGYRIHPVYGSIHYHSGVDIAADPGTPIPAVDAGTVILAGFNEGYGLCVMIEHENGSVSVYGHCSRVLVSVGERVRRNQVIAEVGSTGVSTGPHLHFEIRINNRCVDPTPWMR